MNREEIYESIISQKKGINEIPYQKEFLVNNEEFTKPFVLAGGTSSGKTITTAIWIEMFYQNPLNKGKRTLLIPASTTVLRDNMGDTFDMFEPNFSYCVCRNGEELTASIESDCDVVICLPQTLKNSIPQLNHFHNFILDEAHQWYFKKVITAIIEKIKPKNQLLLTGTPSKFVAKGKKKFGFTFVPVMELYDLGLVSDVSVNVISSTYNPSQSDYSSNYGSLSDKYELKESDNTKSLKMVCKEMVSKLNSNSIKLSSNPYSVLGEIDKTLIFCHSQKQANQFYDILSRKGLVGNVLVSHCEVDKDSVEFKRFKEEDDKKVLIAVGRGRLGFSMEDLFNIIDFTLTQSLDMLLQMYGRLLRLPKHNTTRQKIYYKVATKDTAEYFVSLMKGMFSLTDMEWYSTYNGKNMGGMIITNVVNDKVTTKPSTNRTKSKSVKPYVSIEELGIPLDLNFLRNIKSYTDSHQFTTIAKCTLDDVRREFYGLRTPITLDRVIESISKCTSLKEFKNNYQSICRWVYDNGRTDLIEDLERGKSKAYTEEEVKEAIDKCSTLKEFRRDYRQYHRWILKFKKHHLMQHLPREKASISEEEVIESIGKCTTYKELKEQHTRIVMWCINNKRQDLYQHLQRERISVTEEEVKEAIDKCSTLKELREQHNFAYQWCKNRNRIDLYQHLPRLKEWKDKKLSNVSTVINW